MLNIFLLVVLFTINVHLCTSQSFADTLWEDNDHWGFSAFSSALYQSFIYGTTSPEVYAGFRVQYGKFIGATVQGLNQSINTAVTNNQSASLINWLTAEHSRWDLLQQKFQSNFSVAPDNVIGGSRINSLISVVSGYYANSTSASLVPVALAPSIMMPSWLGEMLPKINTSNVYKGYLDSLYTKDSVASVKAILNELYANESISAAESQNVFSEVIEKEFYYWAWFLPGNADTKECVFPPPAKPCATSDKETGLIIGISVLGAAFLFVVIAYRRQVVQAKWAKIDG